MRWFPLALVLLLTTTAGTALAHDRNADAIKQALSAQLGADWRVVDVTVTSNQQRPHVEPGTTRYRANITLSRSAPSVEVDGRDGRRSVVFYSKRSDQGKTRTFTAVEGYVTESGQGEAELPRDVTQRQSLSALRQKHPAAELIETGSARHEQYLREVQRASRSRARWGRRF